MEGYNKFVIIIIIIKTRLLAFTPFARAKEVGLELRNG